MYVCIVVYMYVWWLKFHNKHITQYQAMVWENAVTNAVKNLEIVCHWSMNIDFVNPVSSCFGFLCKHRIVLVWFYKPAQLCPSQDMEGFSERRWKYDATVHHRIVLAFCYKPSTKMLFFISFLFSEHKYFCSYGNIKSFFWLAMVKLDNSFKQSSYFG